MRENTASVTREHKFSRPGASFCIYICDTDFFDCTIYSGFGIATYTVMSSPTVMYHIQVRLRSYFQAKIFPPGPMLQVAKHIILF